MKTIHFQPDFDNIDGFELSLVACYKYDNGETYCEAIETHVTGFNPISNDTNHCRLESLFWSVYQHYCPENKKGLGGVECLADCDTKTEALQLKELWENLHKAHKDANGKYYFSIHSVEKTVSVSGIEIEADNFEQALLILKDTPPSEFIHERYADKIEEYVTNTFITNETDNISIDLKEAFQFIY